MLEAERPHRGAIDSMLNLQRIGERHSLGVVLGRGYAGPNAGSSNSSTVPRALSVTANTS
jgi:hypothetical protein